MSKYTKDFLIQQLNNYYDEFRRPPSSVKFHIHQNNYRYHFGNWNNALKAANIPTYTESNQISTICKECRTVFTQLPSENKQFCNRSCSVSHSNKNRIMSEETKNKIRIGREKYLLLHPKPEKSSPPFCKIKFRECKQCKQPFLLYRNKNNSYTTRKTCSDACKSTLLSNQAKKHNLGGNWNRKSTWYISPIAGRVHLESSWELKLAKDLDFNLINWNRPKRSFVWISKKQTSHKYYPDFYLPDYDCYIDPKNEFLQMQDEFKIKYVIKHHNIKLLILSEHQLSWNSVRDLI